MQGELKFQKTRNEALNFEIARLKRWRFGSSSESLDTTLQAVRFDRIFGQHRARRPHRARREQAAGHGAATQRPGGTPGAAREPAAH